MKNHQRYTPLITHRVPQYLATLALLAVIALTVSAAALAEPVAPDRARAVVSAFLEHDPDLPMISPQAEPRGVRLIDPVTGRLLAYVYEPTPTGYVVVAADTRIEPVIAYSTTGPFPWHPSPCNALLTLLYSDLPLRLAAVTAGAVDAEHVAANEQTWRTMAGDTSPKDETVWGPWITFPTWNQDVPYWNDCPIDPVTGERCYTGCGPTALAQILTYWRYPSSVTFTADDDYVTDTRGIAIDAAGASLAAIDYRGGTPGDETKAALSYAAGVAVEVDYTSEGSGSSAANLAASLAGDLPAWSWVVDERWGYASADFRTTDPDWQPWPPYFVTEAELYDLLEVDLQAGQPAILSISSDTSGHMIVADGLKATGEVHLNYGWGGTGDGWYFLPDGMPYGYNAVERGVFDISPPLPDPSTAVFRVDRSGHVMADRTVHAASLAFGQADVAEWVPIRGPAEAGDVLALDPTQPGAYRVSATACSFRIAGVVSTVPGVTLGADRSPARRCCSPWWGSCPPRSPPRAARSHPATCSSLHPPLATRCAVPRAHPRTAPSSARHSSR